MAEAQDNVRGGREVSVLAGGRWPSNNYSRGRSASARIAARGFGRRALRRKSIRDKFIEVRGRGWLGHGKKLPRSRQDDCGGDDREIEVVGDMEIALPSRSGSGAGRDPVIAGTVRLPTARDAQGRTARAGGWALRFPTKGRSLDRPCGGRHATAIG